MWLILRVAHALNTRHKYISRLTSGSVLAAAHSAHSEMVSREGLSGGGCFIRRRLITIPVAIVSLIAVKRSGPGAAAERQGSPRRGGTLPSVWPPPARLVRPCIVRLVRCPTMVLAGPAEPGEITGCHRHLWRAVSGLEEVHTAVARDQRSGGSLRRRAARSGRVGSADSAAVQSRHKPGADRGYVRCQGAGPANTLTTDLHRTYQVLEKHGR